MLCPSCKHENRPRRKFCVHCGAGLELACPSCGASSEPGERFCGECGEPLAEPAKPRPPPDPLSYTPNHLAEKILTSRSALEGERKQVTVLFADVKGSMDLVQQVDPEEWHEILNRFFAILSDGVHRFEGTVNQYTGDGIMALFGAPIAHEDHARRACYTALHLTEELRRYAQELRRDHGLTFAVRMGLNSGEVVVGKIGDNLRMDYTAQGHTVGLAARMEDLAEPGKVYLTEATAALVSGYFRLEDLGRFTVKGVHEPLHVFELQGVGALRTALERSRARGFSRFVGRVDEMAALEAALARAVGGSGQVVGLVADPGLGKSRLSFEFTERCRARGIAVYEAHGVSHGKLIAFLPVFELFHAFFRITDEDREQAAREKIAGRMLLLDESLRDALPLVFDFLSVPDPDRPLPPMEPAARQRQLHATVKRIVQARSQREPAVVLLEDLQWFDSGSEGVLEVLVDAARATRTLLVVNFRPEYHAGWMQKSYYQQLPLLPLAPAAIDELLRDLLGADPSLTELSDRIRERTGGTPFFIEEMVQALAEAGSLAGTRGAYRLVRSTADLALPATVQAVLAARIDRLGEREKLVLQTAAVIGREFGEPILRRVADLPEMELAAVLAKLTSAEFIYEQALFPEREYTFKHALTQEVAYHSVLMERRKVLHERTSQAIETAFGSSLEDHYGDLAHHYSCSTNRQKAVEYLQLAGQQAAQRSANAEAINHLTSALEILRVLPDTPQRAQRELALQMMLGPVLIATRGNGAAEVGAAYKRALELGRQVGPDAQLFPVLFGLRSFHLTRGELHPAFDLARQLMSVAESVQDSGLLVEAHLAQGSSLLLFGKFGPALAHFERAIALYDPREHRVHAFLYGLDPGVFCLGWSAWCLAFLGHLDQASKKVGKMLALAHQQSHAFSLAFAFLPVCAVHELRGEWAEMQQTAEAAIAFCTERGFGNHLAQATQQRGYAVAQQGQTEEGIELMRRGLAAHSATWARSLRTFYLCHLAQAYGAADRFEEALAVVAEAIAVMEKTDERLYEAKLHLLKGELVLRRSAVETEPGAQTEAEECFRKAIEIAHRQEAKYLELKAVMSLRRLWRQQGKKAEGRRLLADIYGWFTEGFETKDLQEAKTLLEDLSR